MTGATPPHDVDEAAPAEGRRRLVAWVALLALVAASVAGGLALDDDASADAVPNLGRFVVECPYVSSAPTDPIVWPGQPGASHLHDFFGAIGVEPDTVADDLPDLDTTCTIREDRASYWAPALFLGDEQIPPNSSDAYYRAAPGVDPSAVEPFPFGLMMIGGDAGADGPQDTAIVGWGCGRNPRRAPEPITCGSRSPLTSHITFPDCWDGVSLDSADHRSHVAYSDAGSCPRTHPVHVPQLELVVQYPFWGDPTGLRLASGAVTTAHADFLNGWDEEYLAREVAHCIGLDAICGVPSL